MIRHNFSYMVIFFVWLTFSGSTGLGLEPEASPIVSKDVAENIAKNIAKNIEGAQASHGGEHHEAGLLDINWGILISQTLNFFVLLFILKKFLYGPINEVLIDRKKRISDNIQSADTKLAEANDLKSQYEQKLGTITDQAYQIKQQAIGEAQLAKEEILGSAKNQAASLLEKANKEILRERQKAWVELREEVVRLSLLAAEKVIEKSLDEKTHHDLIKNMIIQLEKPQ
ncbi:F0F1 ATP synthase subunit B [bacterium]|nr:F0F1 ATP synthase subunit B [bacterium]